MQLTKKFLKLITSGYGGWVLYRIIRYARSFASQSNSFGGPVVILSPVQILALMEEFNSAFRVSHRKVLCLHLYYSEIIEEILSSDFLKEEKCDLYISIGPQVDIHFFKRLQPWKGTVKIYQFANKGRDIFPFLQLYPELFRANYDWICKLHSKRSPQIRDGELWRKDIFSDLLSIQRIPQLRSEKTASILPPRYSLLPVNLFMGGNDLTMRRLLKDMGVDRSELNFLFVSGSMFWFRTAALQKILNLKDVESYFQDNYQIDGNTEHAFERLFYFLATESRV